MDRETAQEIYRRHRAEKKKKRRKNLFKRFVFFTFIFALLVTGVYMLYTSDYFNIAEINCTGNSVVPSEEIIKVSGINNGDNLFMSSVKRAENNISEISYVDTYKVWRTLPNKINIRVTETTPIAYIGSNENLWIVNKEGKLLEKAESFNPDKGIPLITGIVADDYKAGDFLHKSRNRLFTEGLECAKVLESLGLLNRTNEINIENNEDIKLSYDNRLYIYIGSLDTFEYKMGVIKRILDKKGITDYEHAVLNYRTDKLYVGNEDMFSDKEESDADKNLNEKADSGIEDINNENVTEPSPTNSATRR